MPEIRGGGEEMGFKVALVAIGLVFLAACGGFAGYCEGQGHTPGTAEFADCVAAEQAEAERLRNRKYRP